jgi:hypothetical protein
VAQTEALNKRAWAGLCKTRKQSNRRPWPTARRALPSCQVSSCAAKQTHTTCERTRTHKPRVYARAHTLAVGPCTARDLYGLAAQCVPERRVRRAWSTVYMYIYVYIYIYIHIYTYIYIYICVCVCIHSGTQTLPIGTQGTEGTKRICVGKARQAGGWGNAAYMNLIGEEHHTAPRWLQAGSMPLSWCAMQSSWQKHSWPLCRGYCARQRELHHVVRYTMLWSATPCCGPLHREVRAYCPTM